MARSVYYYWRKRPEINDSRYGQEKQMIGQLFHKHQGRYGYRRIVLALKHMGCHLNHKTVCKLMKQLHLKSTLRPKRYKSYRGEIGRIAPNYLSRSFEAHHPNEKWVTDVTEFNVCGQKMFLSPILDLYNREIISYELHECAHLGEVLRMVNSAAKQLGVNERPLLHSDQGWQYQMGQYQQTLKDHGITQSMSRKGNCLDNAVMENFFGLLKVEFFYRKKFESVDAFSRGLHEYIHYYNHDRIKEKLKGLSPVMYRIQSLIEPT
jgi:putative transposase